MTGLADAVAPVVAISTGPQLGYLWSASDQTLRPILGVPGASQIGQSLVPAGLYVAGSASPAGTVAVLVAIDRRVYRMTLPDGPPALIEIMAGPGSVIKFSPSGSTALLYPPGSSKVSVLTGLSSSPQVKQVALSSPVLEAAVSDTGTVAAFVSAMGGVAVEIVSPTGTRNSLGSISGGGGLSFVSATENLLIADSLANTVTLVRSSSTSPSAAVLSTGGLLKAPLAIGVSRNGQWAVAVNGGEASAVRIDLTSQAAPQAIACGCRPSLVEQLAGNGVFRLTDLTTGPVWMIDMAASSPQMLFIPALPLAAVSSKQASILVHP